MKCVALVMDEICSRRQYMRVCRMWLKSIKVWGKKGVKVVWKTFRLFIVVVYCLPFLLLLFMLSVSRLEIYKKKLIVCMNRHNKNKEENIKIKRKSILHPKPLFLSNPLPHSPTLANILISYYLNSYCKYQ